MILGVDPDEASDPRWGYDDLGQKERGWTVDERDTFVREMRAAGANWSHHDGRMQSVWFTDARVHICFGDRPEDRMLVWVIRFDNERKADGPRWLHGGPDVWHRAIIGGGR